VVKKMPAPVQGSSSPSVGISMLRKALDLKKQSVIELLRRNTQTQRTQRSIYDIYQNQARGSKINFLR
jgi:hypothetical protein